MQPVGKKLWIIRKDFSVPAFGNIGGCSTIMEYDAGKLMIISPVKFAEDQLQEIKKLGEVRFLVSPNPLHHLYLPNAKEIFPKALIAGPPRSALKEEDLEFDVILTEDGKFPWASGVETLHVQARAPLDEEYLFFHRASKTLVVADFMFNVRNPGSWWNHFWMKLNKADGNLTMTRFGELMFRADSIREVLQKIEALNPENLVMCHGEPIIGNAAPRIRESFAEL